jgi:pyruvate/2-oxoglutarate dehydrogenase complex dihydrolipoamide dehydrogenase (E3) component
MKNSFTNIMIRRGTGNGDMAQIEQLDAIVIGAGQGGNPLSRALAGAGMRTALIEREFVGGTCINTGCTPTKTLIASAEAAHLARQAEVYGIKAGPVRVDMPAVYRRKQALVEDMRNNMRTRLENTENLELIDGEASFIEPYVLQVRLNQGGERVLSARKIFIDIGGSPRKLSIPGADRISVCDSRSIMELQEVPEKLLIIGGGYVGLEFAQMFQRFGSQVTIIQHNGQLLDREDKDIASAVLKIMQKNGIEVFLNASARAVEPLDSGNIRLTVETPEGEVNLTATHLMAAIGREPNTQVLNLQAAGIELDERGYIRVNERLETNVAGIYALGDVNGGPAFTHISYDDYRIIAANLLDGGGRTTQDRPVPYTVFTDPQLGRIGLSEQEARAQNRNIRVAKMPMNWVARARELSKTDGMIKAVVDAESGQILGCAVLGVEGGELMAMIQIAMMGKLHYSTLRDAVFTHPSLSESLNTLFSTLDD